MSMFETVGAMEYDAATDKLEPVSVESVLGTDENYRLTYDEISDMINTGMTYKDGFSIWASYVRWVSEDAVTVYVEFEAANSSPSSVDPRPYVIASGQFQVKRGTKREVQAAILAGLMGVEAHETCEFLRFDGVAPFHPHRQDGRDAYKDASRHHRLPVVDKG